MRRLLSSSPGLFAALTPSLQTLNITNVIPGLPRDLPQTFVSFPNALPTEEIPDQARDDVS